MGLYIRNKMTDACWKSMRLLGITSGRSVWSVVEGHCPRTGFHCTPLCPPLHPTLHPTVLPLHPHCTHCIQHCTPTAPPLRSHCTPLCSHCTPLCSHCTLHCTPTASHCIPHCTPTASHCIPRCELCQRRTSHLGQNIQMLEKPCVSHGMSTPA